MTDKQLKKLKKDELLEILFYMRSELDDVRQENLKLKKSVEELQRSYLSPEDISKIMEAVEKVLTSQRQGD